MDEVQANAIRNSIPVNLLQRYVARRLAQAASMVDDATTTEQLWEAKGFRKAFRSLQNLPEAIIMDLEAEEDGKRGTGAIRTGW